VGASVFLTSSIPEDAMVRMKDAELKVRTRRRPDKAEKANGFGSGGFQQE
jgi:hypothetical protein